MEELAEPEAGVIIKGGIFLRANFCFVCLAVSHKPNLAIRKIATLMFLIAHGPLISGLFIE